MGKKKKYTKKICGGKKIKQQKMEKRLKKRQNRDHQKNEKIAITN